MLEVLRLAYAITFVIEVLMLHVDIVLHDVISQSSLQ